ncbi:MAG: NUDIX hydrolase [Syntrophales bacterium]|nr:NUDIX hydrolase [Syntrophales bacterium]
MISPAREAATVILLRQKPDDIEALMVKRHPANLFVPDCYVFPGGAVENNDLTCDLEDLCVGLNRQTAFDTLRDTSSPEMALAAWIAGIRETFEETGILLVTGSSGSVIRHDSGSLQQKLHRYRSIMQEGIISFRSVLESEGLRLATDRIFYFSHWITPIGSQIRYDVRFFITEAPSGQVALHDSRELTEHIWISPREALFLYEGGRFEMVLPTVMTLRDLCRFKTVDDALAHAKGKHISAVLTKLKKIDDAYMEVMPDDMDEDEFNY